MAACLGLAAGCRPGRTGPSGPFAPAPRAELTAVAAATMPAGYELLRVRWQSDDGQVNLSGTGALRVAPDSLRVDMAVRLGVGRATLILTGDVVQAEPAAMVEQMLPDRYALWAALGAIRLPEESLEVSRLDDGARTFWRVRDGQGRESTFELVNGALAGAVRTQGGRALARLELTRGADGRVSRALVTDMVRGARFQFEVTSRQASEAFPDAIWRLRP